jgi:hypothetical protein
MTESERERRAAAIVRFAKAVTAACQQPEPVRSVFLYQAIAAAKAELAAGVAQITRIENPEPKR